MWSVIVKDGLKALVPFKPFIRATLRKAFPYRSLPSNDNLALEQGLQLIKYMSRYGINCGTVLEVGTGWIPTIPHLLLAQGVDKLVLTDVDRLCDTTTFDHAKTFVRGSLGKLKEVSAENPEALSANLEREGITEYRCPPDTESIPSETIDLVYSRTVLEHIAKGDLHKLTSEWMRLLRPGSFCIHFIDNSDHFEHRDRSLSRLNFLSVSNWVWKLSCLNPQIFQNRLRHSDYLKLFSEAGFDILLTEGQPDQQALADLEHLAINHAFSHYDKTDLATLTTIIVAQKPSGTVSH